MNCLTGKVSDTELKNGSKLTDAPSDLTDGPSDLTNEKNGVGKKC